MGEERPSCPRARPRAERRPSALWGTRMSPLMRSASLKKMGWMEKSVDKKEIYAYAFLSVCILSVKKSDDLIFIAYDLYLEKNGNKERASNYLSFLN